MVTEDYLFHFEFLGRVLAKAVFEDILVEPQFSQVFLNKLLGRVRGVEYSSGKNGDCFFCCRVDVIFEDTIVTLSFVGACFVFRVAVTRAKRSTK